MPEHRSLSTKAVPAALWVDTTDGQHDTYMNHARPKDTMLSRKRGDFGLSNTESTRPMAERSDELQDATIPEILPLFARRSETYSTGQEMLPQLDLGPRLGWNRSHEDVDLLSPASQSPRKHNTQPFFDERNLNFDGERSATDSAPAQWTNHELLANHLKIQSHSGQRSLEPKADHAVARHVLSNNTPLSAHSDRTEHMEVNEAKAINIYPHNNDSLLLVQQRGSQRQSVPLEAIESVSNESTGSERDNSAKTKMQPIFTAFVRPSTPPVRAFKGLDDVVQVDSPLTNPRAAPFPPAIKFIPPTPNDEVDRQLGGFEEPEEAKTSNRRDEDCARPVRRQSLMEKARRYSESFVQPFLGRNASLSSRRRRHSIRQPGEGEEPEGERATNLHPLWRPRGFWDDFDSESEEDYDGDHCSDDHEPLPRGGDTSDTGYDAFPSSRSKTWRPRQMSVRMPGFRGTGGFLLGNSLGLGRHGTNNRRHYVDPPASIRNTSTDNVPASNGGLLGLGLRKRKSEHMLRTLTASSESLRRRGLLAGGSANYSKRQRTQRFPRLPGGLQVQYVGVRGFRDRVRQMKGDKSERAAERRREELRGKIGPRVWHET